jgi:hypothetical protein
MMLLLIALGSLTIAGFLTACVYYALGLIEDRRERLAWEPMPSHDIWPMPGEAERLYAEADAIDVPARVDTSHLYTELTELAEPEPEGDFDCCQPDDADDTAVAMLPHPDDRLRNWTNLLHRADLNQVDELAYTGPRA